MRRRPRRPLRILLNAATVLSLVLCVVTVAAWVRSYWLSEMWTRGHQELGADSHRKWLWQFASAGGSVSYFGYSEDVHGLGKFNPQVLADLRAILSVPANRDTRGYQSRPRTQGRATFGLTTTLGFGFKFHRDAPAPPSTGSSWSCSMTVPYWAVTGACAVPLAVCLRCIRRRHKGDRADQDPASLRCPACGYDCRATPDRCPECGTALVAVAAAAGPAREGKGETEGV